MTAEPREQSQPGSTGRRGIWSLVALVFGVLAALAVLLGSPESFRDALTAFLGKRIGNGSVELLSSPVAFMSSVAGEKLSFILLLLLATAVVALLTAGRRAAQIRAVVRTASLELVRGGELWGAALVALSLSAAAFFLRSEGGPVGRIRMIVTAACAAAALVGTLMAIALPALGLSRENETRSLQLMASKPLPRWTFFVGRMLAVALALAVTVAAAGLGGTIAAAAALGTTARADDDAAGPEAAWLTAWYARPDDRPPAAPGPDGRRPPPRRLYRRDGPLSFDIPATEADAEGQWLVLRIHARPAEPMMESAPANLTCGRDAYRVNLRRSAPVDLVVPAAAASGGRLSVTLEPALDSEGIDSGLRTDPRGTVVLARPGDSLPVSLAKSMAAIWMQLLVVAAATLAAAAAMSMQVSALVGASIAAAGHLSGLAVSVMRAALATGTGAEAVEVHIHGPGCGHDAAGAITDPASPLSQLVRHAAAGVFSLLPDFEATGTSDFLASGSQVPWSFIAAAALVLLVLRALPLTILGCLVLTRREVGA